MRTAASTSEVRSNATEASGSPRAKRRRSATIALTRSMPSRCSRQDLVAILPHFGRRIGGDREILDQPPHVGRDEAHGVVDLVRDAGGEHADARELVAGEGALLRGLERLVGQGQAGEIRLAVPDDEASHPRVREAHQVPEHRHAGKAGHPRGRGVVQQREAADRHQIEGEAARGAMGLHPAHEGGGERQEEE